MIEETMTDGDLYIVNSQLKGTAETALPVSAMELLPGWNLLEKSNNSQIMSDGGILQLT